MKEATPLAYRGLNVRRGQRLYQAPDLPDLVLRRPMPKESFGEEIIIEGDAKFAQLLIDLDEKYGIKTPKMSMLEAEDFTSEKNMIFVGSQKVSGKNLFYNASKIPVEVVEKAVRAIINYYQDAKKNGGDYITDLTPENIMYGRLSTDSQDELYFIDLDPYFVSSIDDDASSLDDNVQQRVFSQLRSLIAQRLDGRDSSEQLFKDLAGLPSHP